MLLTFGMSMDQSYATAISSGQDFMLCRNVTFSTMMASYVVSKCYHACVE